MAAGLLGKAALAAGIYTSVYKATAGLVGGVNIRLVNRDKNAGVQIRLAICPPGYVAPAAPADEDWIEPLDLDLGAAGVLEETAVAMSPGEQVVAFAQIASVTARVHGFER